jgi:hypothetical protein
VKSRGWFECEKWDMGEADVFVVIDEQDFGLCDRRLW